MERKLQAQIAENRGQMDQLQRVSAEKKRLEEEVIERDAKIREMAGYMKEMAARMAQDKLKNQVARSRVEELEQASEENALQAKARQDRSAEIETAAADRIGALESELTRKN